MKIRGIIAYLLPGLGAIVWMAVFLGVIGLGPRMMNIDGDLGRHLTIGRYILSAGHIPTTDLFSHTLYGQALTPHEWLAQVIFAVAYQGLGLSGVVVVCALVIASTFWLVFRRAQSTSRTVLLAVGVTVLAMAASSLHWLTRPHVFTFLMLALWIDSLERLRIGYLRSWWRLPVLMLLWTNLHGAFIAGFVVWGIYGFGLAWDIVWSRSLSRIPDRFIRFYLLAGLVSLLATFVNPVGPVLWGTSLGYIGNRYLVGHTAEYLPPNFHDPSTLPFLAMIGVTTCVFGLSGRKLMAEKVFLLSAWMLMALYSVRNVPLFAIVAAAPLAGLMSRWATDAVRQRSFLGRWLVLEDRLLQVETQLRGVLWPVILVGLVVIGLYGGAALDFSGAGDRFDARVFPVAAVDWMQSHPPEGQGFNYFPWGGYLLYRLWPEQRVFIDGQTDFYGEELTRQYEQVLTLSQGWEQVFRQYHIRWVLMPADEPLTSHLKDSPGWQVDYQDETAVLLVMVP